jgi:predicted Ser/Thr protein kinase
MRVVLPTGARLGGFRVVSLLGEGAMGAVYLAEDEATGRRVALKLLVPELADDDRFRRRFARETEIAARLDHPNVVRVLASGEAGGALYLAMEFVDGSDLRKLLRSEGPLEVERTLALLEQVAAALDAAHTAGLVHRDVKPGNVLVASADGGEHAWVCDFGLARHVSAVSSLTSDRGFVGTIDYVPPEQIEGETITARADVYSLGCVLYECLSGRRPFDRDSELSVLFAHLNEPPPRLSDVRPDLPEALDAVIATALAKSPEDRQASCGELVSEARAAVEGRPVKRRGRRRPVLVAATAAGVVVVAAVAGVVGLTSSGRGTGTASAAAIALRPSSLAAIDPRTHSVLKQIDLGVRIPVADTSAAIAFTKRAAWVLLGEQQRLVRVDLATRKRTRRIALPWTAGGITATRGAVWVAEDIGPEVWRIDPASGGVVQRLHLRGARSEGELAYGAGSLWLASGPGVVRVDPSTGRIQHTFPLPGISGGMRIVFADGSVWAARPGNGVVAKIDPIENRVVHETPLHGWLTDLAVGGGSVWVSIVPDGQVYRLSEDNLGVRGSIPAGRDPERLSFGSGELWVSDDAQNRLVRIGQVSAGRGAIAARGAEPSTAAYHDGVLWVGAAPALPPLPPIHGQQLRIVGGGVPDDPTSTNLFDEQVLYATCAKLLNYPDASGAAGARLRPEIAAAMPTLSPDGRTYTFRIRPGFRFSPPSDQPVTAETMRHTIEREIATSSAAQGTLEYGGDIVGAQAFSAGRARQVSGLAVHGNRLSITLVKPAGDFLTRLAMPRFCAVPLSTPLRGTGPRLPPSAGPYYVASSEGPRSVLLRNPNYHGSRPRRSARIVFEDNVLEAEAIPLVDRGAADLIPSVGAGDLLVPGGPVDRRAKESTSLARQYHVHPGPLIDYLVFNTRRPLFRDARMRRAVDLALDRRALAGAFADAPADRVVPPAVPGYPAGRVFPLSPDDASARRLAGRGAHHAVLYVCGDPRGRTLADLVSTDLARIRIGVKVAEDELCPAGYLASPRSRNADLLLVQGFPYSLSAERDPAQSLDELLVSAAYGSPLPSAGWNAHAFRRDFERALPLRGASRAAAFHRLADELTRWGPIAVFGSWVWPEYFSAQVGCKVFQTVYGAVDLGALCKHA